MRAFLLVLSLLATPAMAADQFDLVCKGQQRTSAAGKWKPYEVRYRVDLSEMVYCRFNCKTLETVESADAARIVFQSVQGRPGSTTALHYVDRSDGNWRYFLSGPVGLIGDAEGHCEAAPFSGFPAAKF